jgi:hypothetical protein
MLFAHLSAFGGGRIHSRGSDVTRSCDDKILNVAVRCRPRLTSRRYSAKVFSMKVLAFAAAMAAGLVLSGCATMVTGSSEDIAVLTPPVAGASCELSNLEGNWTVVTPTVAHVQRGHDDLTVKCSKPGYQEAWTRLPSDTDPMTFANFANLGVGFAVDSYTGAIDGYPHSVQLPMQPVATASAQTPQGALSAPATPPPAGPAN